MARQQRITLDGQHFFIDLVFYNRLTRSFDGPSPDLLVALRLTRSRRPARPRSHPAGPTSAGRKGPGRPDPTRDRLIALRATLIHRARRAGLYGETATSYPEEECQPNGTEPPRLNGDGRPASTGTWPPLLSPDRAASDAPSPDRNIGRDRDPGPKAGDSPMTRTVHGVIRGKTIELDEDLGLAEGQDVEIILKTARTQRTWGEGILRTAGALADDPYWDDIMEQIHQDRKRDRQPQMEDR